RWSRRLYNRLTGLPDEGTLVVNANVDGGTVYVDGEVKGTLARGTVQISGLTEGKHEVRVESQGRAPFSTEVSIKGGETHDVKANLAGAAVGPGGGGGGASTRDDGEGRPGGVSRALFWTTAVIAVGAGGGALYTNMEKSDLEKKVPPGGCAQAEFKGDCDR